MYKILIRPLEKKDALISWKWRNDSDIWEFTGSRPNITITPEIEINWIEKILADSNSRRFAITVDDIYVGNIQLTNITRYDAEYHIFIGEKSYWGKGIAFSATQQIIRFAKNNLKLDNIYLKVKPENLKAIKLYEKSGFEVISDEVKMVLSLEKMVKPMVSIFCMVYNHEAYIKDCLDGFLIQTCNFDFEIVVGEDFSSDNSRAILKEYDQKYPGKFKLLLHENNIGAIQNQKLVFENCTGKFIAMCEGDDYWIDPHKLQKQVDFLEANGGFVACFSNASVQNGFSQQFNDYIETTSDKIYKIDEIIKQGGGLFPTASLFFRNVVIDYPSFMYKTKSGDRALSLILATYGDFYFMNECSVVYRLHPGGVFNSIKTNPEERKRFNLDNIDLLQQFNNFTDFKYNLIIQNAISQLSKIALLRSGKSDLFSGESGRLIKNLKFNDFLSFLFYKIRGKI